jgi:beta-lactamase superfamily II metal-dependent hydrolase
MQDISPRMRRALRFTIPVLLVLAAYLVLAAADRGPTISILEGAGPAILVRTSARTVLVDAGADASILRALGQTLPPWQRSLSALVLTSVSTSGADGTPDVLARYRTAEIIRPVAQGSASREAALAQARDASSVRTVYAARGDRFALGDGVYLDVLWPPETPTPLGTKDGALVLRLECGSSAVDIAPDGLPAHDAAWLAVEDGRLPTTAFTITSSTPPSSYACSRTGVR